LGQQPIRSSLFIKKHALSLLLWGEGVQDILERPIGS
jgi:hypothetical protein